MSTPLSIDAYDAQMLDFSDPDVTMNITGSTEFFSEALMDHDGHLSTAAYGEHASVEVDMEEYIGDNAEYEMADETAVYHRSHGEELLDIEVYDASHVPSPLVPSQPLLPSPDAPIDSGHPAPTSVFTGPAALPEVQGEPQPEVQPAPLNPPVADAPHVESLASGESVPLEAVSSELAHSTDVTDEGTLPISESHEQLGDATHTTTGGPSETPVTADAVDEARFHVPPVAEGHHVDSEVAEHQAPDPPAAESTPFAGPEEAYSGGSLVQDEKAVDQAPATRGEAVDPLHISDGVYIDPPPAVLLAIADVPQPKFVLFNQPEVEGESAGESHGNGEDHSLLLENRPTLYYEPLSSVFEALRQDEVLLSRIPHSFEGELVLDAFDLQLTVSEDNVHSREISLHDLHVIHDGSDFTGPLRLRLRAIVPRFIMRFYALQAQIQTLNTEAGEGEHDQEHHEEYETSEEQHPPEEVVNPTRPAVASDSSEIPLITEFEEPTSEPVYLPEEARENGEPEDMTVVQHPTAEYHEVTGEVTRALENEDDHEGTNTGEDGSAKAGNVDADQVHVTIAEDTDAVAAVTGQEPEFEGEQTEYPDYVQPEEFDERYGEDLPERAGGASPVQYGEPQLYEEGEQDTSTALDEAQATLLGSEEGEDRSAATPVPVRAALEPEASGSADQSVADESVSSQKNDSTLGKAEPTTSESTAHTVHDQTSANQEPDVTKTEILSKVDESDSNFVSILERKADTESDRTFDAEQNGQESSTETALQLEANWDEWDDEDAEGEDEENWIDPDAVSDESSITLSSKTSSKRNFNEVDPSEEELYVEDPHVSPGSKRPRVQ